MYDRHDKKKGKTKQNKTAIKNGSGIGFIITVNYF